jgi:hypothetical protein
MERTSWTSVGALKGASLTEELTKGRGVGGEGAGNVGSRTRARYWCCTGRGQGGEVRTDTAGAHVRRRGAPPTDAHKVHDGRDDHGGQHRAEEGLEREALGRLLLHHDETIRNTRRASILPWENK